MNKILGALCLLVTLGSGVSAQVTLTDLDRAAIARWGSAEIAESKVTGVYKLPDDHNGVAWSPYTMTPGHSQLDVNLGDWDAWKCYVFSAFVIDSWRRFAGPGADGALGDYGGRDLIAQDPNYVRKYSDEHWDTTVEYLKWFPNHTDLMAITQVQMRVDSFFHTNNKSKPSKFWEDLQKPLAAKQMVMVMVAQNQGNDWVYHAVVVYRVIKFQNEVLVFFWDPVVAMNLTADEQATHDTATFCTAAGRLDTDEWDMSVGSYGTFGVLNSVSVLKWAGM